MREVTINRWCDQCFAADESRVPADHTYTVGVISGETRPELKVVELCGKHGVTLLASLVVLLDGIGQRPEIAPAPPPRLRRDEPNPCPVPGCTAHPAGKNMATHLKSHLRHKFSQPDKCPDCGQPFESGGMGVHRATAHGWSAVAELVERIRLESLA